MRLSEVLAREEGWISQQMLNEQLVGELLEESRAAE